MKKVATVLTAAVAVSLFGPLGTAHANDTTTEPNLTQSRLTNTEFVSFIAITDHSGTYLVENNDEKLTLGEFMESKELDPKNYRTYENKPLDLDQVLENNSHTRVYQVSATTKSKEFTIEAPTVKKKTDDLFEGETKVKEKGKDGRAIRVVVKTDVSSNADSEMTEETIKVLEAAEPRVVLVGTKPIPEPEPEPTPEPTRAQAASEATRSHSTASAPSRSAERSTPPRVSNPTPAPSTPAPEDQGVRDDDARAGDGGSFSVGIPGSYDKSNPLVVELYEHVGMPYVWGSAGPNAFDCSGFVYWVFNQAGYSIGRDTAAGYGNRATPVSVNDLQAGDIIWNSGHIAIYAGDGKVVHAASPKWGVVVTDLGWFTKSGDYKYGRLF